MLRAVYAVGGHRRSGCPAEALVADVNATGADRGEEPLSAAR
jgi:hypothetical protein